MDNLIDNAIDNVDKKKPTIILKKKPKLNIILKRKSQEQLDQEKQYIPKNRNNIA